jgi:hypothetical protein
LGNGQKELMRGGREDEDNIEYIIVVIRIIVYNT